MGKCRENAKYNVLSIRVTNQEKAAIDEMMRETRKSVSMLMREAMHQYTSFVEDDSGR
jgi:predicted transcriptional regulator